MKIGAFFLLALILLPVLSALTVDMKPSYDQGETIIAKVSGNFVDPLNEDNLVFKRGHVKIPIDYDLGKIDEDYYIRASLTGKTPDNYSLEIKNVRYWQGGQITSQDFVKNFTITSNTAPFSVKPAFFITNKDFSTQVQSLASSLTININVPSGISSPSSTSLSSGQIKTIIFNASGLTQTTTSSITLTSGSLSYTLPFYFLYIASPEPPIKPDCTINSDCGDGYKCSNNKCVVLPPEPYCGDNDINVAGEICDGNDFGPITNGCAAYLFNAGTLSCNPPGSTDECRVDISNCYTISNVQCTPSTEEEDCNQGQICVNNKCVTSPPEPEDLPCGNNAINPGELCDNSNWGAISSCVNFGFDKGTLSCSNSCTFNTSSCANNPVIIEPECKKNSECLSNQQCIDEECVNNPPVDCTYAVDCGASVFECVGNECVLKVQCEDNGPCSEFEECESGRCTLKEGDECIRNIDCKADYECIVGFCEKIIECRFNSECRSYEKCEDDKCVLKDIECRENDECDDNELCEDNECVEIEEECIEDFDCRNGYECISNTCFEKPNRCNDNGDCNSTQFCFRNYCAMNLSHVNNTNVDPLVSKTCSELGGKFCTSSQTCEGDSRNIKSSVCCLGSCKSEGGGSSSTKIIGWAIIIAIGVFIIWFFRKFKSSTAKKTPDFLKR